MDIKRIHGLVERQILEETGAGDVFLDAAFLGSFSGHYGWRQTRFGDCDLWFLCRDLSDPVFWEWLSGFVERLKERVSASCPDLMITARAAAGPYKPPIASLDREHLFFHLIVDDKRSYRSHSPFTRLSWAKYRCYVKPERLAWLCEKSVDILPGIAEGTVQAVASGKWQPPEMEEKDRLDLLSARYGILDTLQTIRAGSFNVTMYEQRTGKRSEAAFYSGMYEYTEFLLYASMTNARNLGRLRNWEAADKAPNRKYVEYFCRACGSALLRQIYEIKAAVEQNGYGAANQKLLSDLTGRFMMELLQEVEMSGRIWPEPDAGL